MLDDRTTLQLDAEKRFLDAVADSGFDRATCLAARLLSAPIALLSFFDDRQSRLRSQYGLAQLWSARQDGLWFARLSDRILSLATPLCSGDVGQDAAFRDDPAACALGVTAYAAVPLSRGDLHPLGMLCVCDTKPRRWTADEITTLQEIAGTVLTEIELRGTRRRLEEDRIALERKAEVLQAVLDDMGDGVLVLDLRGRVLEINPAARAILGVRTGDDPTEAVRQFEVYLGDGETRCPEFDRPVVKALRGEPVDQKEVLVRSAARPEGAWVSVTARPLSAASGGIAGAVMVLRDATAQRSAREALSREAETLRNISLIDDLTGLTNRRGFMLLAEQQWRVAQRTRKPILLVFADLDGLKDINDRLGHEEGDRAIVDTAEILRETFRGSDVIARLGGDEFVVLATEALASRAEQLTARLESQIQAQNAAVTRPYRLSISVGYVVSAPDAGSSLESLLAAADRAMYCRKRERKLALHEDQRAAS